MRGIHTTALSEKLDGLLKAGMRFSGPEGFGQADGRKLEVCRIKVFVHGRDLR
jgi:hypothetical protein